MTETIRKGLLLTAVWLLAATTVTASDLVSPNGKLTVKRNGSTLMVCYRGQEVMELKNEGAESEGAWKLVGQETADYQMVSGKRLHCTNKANEYRCGDVTLRVYDNGIALRTSDLSPQPSTLSWHIPEGTRRWMQQWCDSYEGFFPLATTCKVKPVPSYSGTSVSADGWNNRWGYPALVEVRSQQEEASGEAGTFVLITEANIVRGHSASCLMNDGEWFRVVPAKTSDAGPQPSTPSPWRVAIVGTLAEVVESTLVPDVSEPCRIADTSWIHPGVVAWIYWAYNHGSNDYGIICQYVDMAVRLRLPYVLIDAEWDEMKDGKTIEDAIRYAREKGVRPLIWYNSSVGWVDGAPGPKFRLNKPEDREREFAWCEQLGVAGVKIDFFSGDDQRNMDYCQDLLESAARHHLLVNFHGATVPRGWQRTWPNLLSTEGVYGAEWYNNVPTFTAKAACHNATLPFTRNVIGPMDYTPCAFSDSQHPHITTHGHELALTVLFESGLQHLADRPESFYAQPEAVQHFLSQLPAAWDETRYVSGYPGESAVLARRCGDTWYVAGVNGKDEEQVLATPLDFIAGGEATLFADGDPWQVTHPATLPKQLTCKPRGGFVLVVKK